MTYDIILGLLIPFLGTVFGSALVFFMKHDMSLQVRKTLLGFASGVMVAASVWSLLLPSLDFIPGAEGLARVTPAAIGFLAGIGFLLLVDNLTPHLHLGTTTPEGLPSHFSRTAMLSLAVTIHNLPEGMAVGVVLAGAMSGDAGISAAGALTMCVGIAIQNIPEGAIISMPMRAEGNSRLRSFLIGSLSGAVELLGGIAVIMLTALLTPVMPYMLAFAAGSMIYVVVEELIPEASGEPHSNLNTIGFAVGFTLMMVLDVVLG